ncbi:hypothetical protein B879_00629 [Cecembia lonarensis LW9]|uniref:DUF4174 domain-containing protein n=2 Tax=Cecembia TaxID=1187078 RepID=K1L7G1_CECL9|nr:hypothetical protein B879_00629 [Cecembia lonarensis LW9]
MPYFMLIFVLFAFWPKEKPKTLEDFRWKNRLLLYFGQEIEKGWNIEDNLAEEINERKLVYLVFTDSLISNQELDFSKEYIISLQKKYAMGAKGPCWVLIGLDGGVKMRKEDVLGWDLVFKTIDAMPMRQSEIRRRGKL